MSKIIVTSFLFLLPFTLTDCARKHPPIEALTKANMAIKKAEQNNAAQAAPLEMRLARENLDQAERAMQEKNYTAARRHAEEATVQAELGESKAGLKQTESKTTEAQESLETIKNEMNKTTDGGSK